MGAALIEQLASPSQASTWPPMRMLPWLSLIVRASCSSDTLVFPALKKRVKVSVSPGLIPFFSADEIAEMDVHVPFLGLPAPDRCSGG
jgi:hypothetical protein